VNPAFEPIEIEAEEAGDLMIVGEYFPFSSFAL
jgi:hypothetical protein